MVIKTHQGLLQVNQVKGYCEARVNFNGEQQRLIKPAKDVSYISALLFCGEKDTGSMSGFFHDAKEVFVGNLKNETAQKYMEVLATTGYLDLTLSEYQKEDPHQRIKYVFDDGNSKPYFDENNASLCVNGSFEINWTGGCLDDDFCSDDEDEYEENED